MDLNSLRMNPEIPYTPETMHNLLTQKKEAHFGK